MADPATTNAALITNDAVVLGLLAVTLGAVFWTSSRESGFWKKFYGYVPALLMCYLLPAIYNSIGLIDGNASGLYPMARDYLLPSALVLLCIAIDLGAVLRLGPKAVIMFLTGTLGVMVGALVSFVAMGVIHPDTVSGDTWRGMTTVAGSWIGGGANQAAMKEVFAVDATLFGQFVAVDVLVANVWMAILLFLAARAPAFDRWAGADTSAIEDLKRRMEDYQAQHSRIPTLTDLMIILGIGLGTTGLAHFLATPQARSALLAQLRQRLHTLLALWQDASAKPPVYFPNTAWKARQAWDKAMRKPAGPADDAPPSHAALEAAIGPDTGAILIAALAYRYAKRNAGNGRFTFGTGKFGDLAGFASAVVLGIVASIRAHR